MPSLLLRSGLALLVAAALAGGPARADDDTAGARAAISGQAEAFGRDDATAAYSFAAPNVRSVFPEADGFMSMVRNGYAPVYRHRSFDFGDAQVTDGKIVQRVHIIDSAGVAWEAIYTLEHASDGTVKITGCVLLKADQSV